MIVKANQRFSLLFRTLEIIAIFFIFMLVNINSFVRFRQFPEVDNYSANELRYVFAAIVTVILIIFLLWTHQLLATYLAAWKNHKLLILFLAYALVSLLWTIYLPATLYKLFWLFFSTTAGSYIAIRYKLRGTIDVLTWAGSIFAILSLLIILYLPFVGVMQSELFIGSWNGLFWHRNHTGNIFAFFSMILLLRFLADESSTRNQKIVFALFYVLSAALVFGSRSATGVIVFLFLQFVVALVMIWLKFHGRIKPWQYYSATALLLAGFLVFVTNTEFFFGLLGRSASMTGRVPLWQDLFSTFYLQKPILGYGYGALWMQKSFRILMQIRHGWNFQVFFGDNGFFDLLLNMGLVGILLFMAIFIPLGVRSLKQAISLKSWIYFFPFLTFLYIFIGNLTYSFLLEVDQFVWMLLVIMVFLTTATNSDKIPQP